MEKARKTCKPLFAVLLTALMTLAFGGSVFASGIDSGKELSFWSENSKVAASITEYVEAATDPASEGYIPEEDRIAVFDLDGTIIGELYPSYFEYMMFIHRALYDDSYTPSAEMRKFAEALEEGIRTGEMPDNNERLHAKYAGEAYAGMTVDEMKAYTRSFMESKADGFENLTRGEAFYKPMVSLVEYLDANDFTCYIVSGSDRTLIRGMIKDILPIPENRVIGMSYTMVASGQDGEDGLEYVYTKDDELIRGGDLVIKTIKMNKVSVIAQEIGKVPVLSFGNSSGDVSMAQYVVNNKDYKGQAYMLCCDDLVREHGNMKKADAMYSTCEEKGFIPVSMKDDFATIYGDDVTITDYTYNEAPPVPDEEIAYTEKEVPVYKKELTDDTIALRFYESAPNVPYIGIKEYYDYVMQDSLDAEKEIMTVTKNEEGTYSLENAHGQALADVENDILSSDNLTDFRNLMCLTQEGISTCYCDGVPYVRISDVKHIGKDEAKLDLGKYNINIYGDAENGDVYFPVPTLSVIFTDLIYHYCAFNGETFYFNPDATYERFDQRDPDYAKPILESLDKDLNRPEDLADYCFNEVCFIVDNFYGLPGRAIINDELPEKGLEQALRECGDPGVKTLELLKSRNFAEYLCGYDMLQLFLDDGGHTHTDMLDFGDADTEKLDQKKAKLEEELEPFYKQIQKEAEERETSWNYYYAKETLRKKAYDGEVYVKEGDTAVFVLDSFVGFNMDALKEYYGDENATEKPDSKTVSGDDMVLLAECIEDADKDPAIKNFVVDCSNNTGGSLDEVAMLVCLLTGQSEAEFVMENAITGMKTVQTYQADTNFDKVFDEKDANPHDLNIAVITTQNSFSCGNIFPSYMKDAGYMTLGEQSGGGACAIQIQTTGEGLPFRMSSYFARLINKDGENVDNGIPVDVDLVAKRSDGKDKMITVDYEYEDEEGNKEIYELRSPDYSELYDIARLSEEVNAFYQK